MTTSLAEAITQVALEIDPINGEILIAAQEELARHEVEIAKMRKVKTEILGLISAVRSRLKTPALELLKVRTLPPGKALNLDDDPPGKERRVILFLHEWSPTFGCWTLWQEAALWLRSGIPLGKRKKVIDPARLAEDFKEEPK